MIVDTNDNNRILIYYFYDRDGKVDRYVEKVLSSMSDYVRDIVVISGVNLSDESRETLRKFSDRIIVQEGIGFDVNVYGFAFNQIGWPNFVNYDEVILMDYSLMGPINSLSDMFDTMSKRDLDFWGISIGHAVEFNPTITNSYGEYSDYILSNFLVIRNTMLVSKVFRKYWKDSSNIISERKAVGLYESYFTQYFADKGYKWQAYIDTEDIRDVTYQPLRTQPLIMVRDKNTPFFMRDSFVQSYDVVLSEGIGNNIRDFYEYLDADTSFDVNTLWDNILRTENMADIKNNMQLNYIIPTNNRIGNISDGNKNNPRVALFMHIYFEDLIDECLGYAQSMPDYADIYITTNDEEKKKKILDRLKSTRCGIIDVKVTQNRGRDVGPFIIEARQYIDQYDYICHVHDKKVGQLRPASVGQAFSYRCFENTLASSDFVSNVIHTFEGNPRMGIIMPSPPNHAGYFFTLGLEWGVNFDITRKLANKLGINVPISSDKEPITPIGSFFWARTDAIKKIIDYPWEYEDFPEEPIYDDGTILHAIERIYGYASQDMGYYAGWLLSDRFARNEYSNMYYMLRGINASLINDWKISGTYKDVISQMNYLTPDVGNGQSVYDSMSTLFYDTGYGIRQDMSIQTQYEVDERDIVWIFDGMSELGKIEELRFDPGEDAGLHLLFLRIIIEVDSGKKYLVDNKKLRTNGKWCDGKLIFAKNDPQIYFCPLKEGVIKSVEIRASVEYGIVQDALYKSNK